MPLIAINERRAIRRMMNVIGGQPFLQTEDNKMKRRLQIALAMIVLGIAGCEDGHYPISGERCTPDDPVLTLDARDCSVVPTY